MNQSKQLLTIVVISQPLILIDISFDLSALIDFKIFVQLVLRAQEIMYLQYMKIMEKEFRQGIQKDNKTP